eukprot:CAMPEP_0172668506 /NCGR_PEP_ID=MMETSP1074-20121228/9099_1 /TAXON_ID=2916 /ORGANISM="Ceratium fusus, Strain PA161109" /LENGTH=580 /DNA_ID=CAMNT_0013485163 /DNA_START=89 /DNA_END=1831 /DNA_ORIENTATION=-
MPASTVLHLVLFTLLSCVTPVQSKGFLMERRGGAYKSATDLKQELRDAMGEAMGCGGHFTEEEVTAIKRDLQPIWRTLPKNGGVDRVERRSLRYLIYRYFNKKSSIMVRGFEPNRLANTSLWDKDDILSQTVPAFVEAALESKHAEVHGFDFSDAVQMVVTMEQLIFDAEGAILEAVYQNQRKPTTGSLSSAGMGQVLEEFMIHWMLNDDKEGIKMLVRNGTLLRETIPHWDQIVGFVRGQVSAMSFQRQQTPASIRTNVGHNALSVRFSYEDAHQAVGNIRTSFASFWESECAAMKAQLVEMDPLNTGRVPLSKFYGTGLDAEWRFGESEAYLRDLGALDETSTWRGKQVIIPNYIQGASNCIVSAEHYSVCCTNECESMIAEIESTIAAPVARVSEILPLVGNMTSQTTVDHDDPPKLEGALTVQLEQIAASHSGMVPLHGRLFAQWLHYAFPHECMFPVKAGTAVSLSPDRYGDGYIATQREMKLHAATSNMDAANASEMGREDLQWMSQWSPEEELMADYAELQASSLSKSKVMLGLVALLVMFAFLGAVGFSHRASFAGSPAYVNQPDVKTTHFV